MIIFNSVQLNMTLPINSYVDGIDGTGAIGGYMYRGCLFPNLNGMYIFADFTRYQCVCGLDSSIIL